MYAFLAKDVLPILLFSIVASMAQPYTLLCVSTTRKLFKPLVRTAIPRQGPLAPPLPNAPPVERLRALAGADRRGRIDRLERSRLTASGRTRSRPVSGDEKDRRWRLFSGGGDPVPNKRFAGVSILLPCLPQLFSVRLGFPPE